MGCRWNSGSPEGGDGEASWERSLSSQRREDVSDSLGLSGRCAGHARGVRCARSPRRARAAVPVSYSPPLPFTASTSPRGHPSRSLRFESGPPSLSFKGKLETQAWPVSFVLPLGRGDGHVTRHSPLLDPKTFIRSSGKDQPSLGFSCLE